MSRKQTVPARRLALAVAAGLLLVPPLVAGPVLASGPGTAGHSRTSNDARSGVLKVKVATLPGARKVVVRGPQRYKRVLTSTTILRDLAPGRYRVTAAKVRTKEWSALPEVSKRRVRVRAGRRAVTRVSFPTVVSTAARVLKARDIEAFTAPSANDPSGTITLSRRAPEGTVLAAGVTPATPYGALVTVLSSSKTSAGWRHDVRIAGLQEAVLRGEYDVPIEANSVPIQGRLAARTPTSHARGTSAGCSGSMEAGAISTAVQPPGRTSLTDAESPDLDAASEVGPDCRDDRAGDVAVKRLRDALGASDGGRRRDPRRRRVGGGARQTHVATDDADARSRDHRRRRTGR